MDRLFFFRFLVVIITLFHTVVASCQTTVTEITPISGSNLFEPKVIFTWNKSSLENINSTYRLIVAADSSFNNTLYTSASLNERSDSFNLIQPSTYFWKVEVQQSGQLVDVSDTFTFTYIDVHKLSNITLFLDPDSGLTVDANNNIEKWINLADTANSAIQQTLSQRPVLSSDSSLNNRALVRFDGTDDLLQINSNVFLGEVFAIANWGGMNTLFPSFNGLVTGQTSNWVFAGRGTGTSNLDLTASFQGYFINNQPSIDFAPLQEFKVLNAQRNNSNPLNLANVNLGRNRTSVNRYWNGNLGDVIGFSAKLNDSLRSIVYEYYCQKYGTSLSLGEDIIVPYGFCDTVVQANPNFTSYLWSNGDTTSSSALTPGNTYRLTVTSEFGCEFFDEVSVIVPIETPPDQILCIGDSFVFNTGLLNNEYTFLWSDSSTDSALVIDQPGDYYVMITDTNGCSFNTDTLTVTFDSSLVNFTLGADTTFCRGNEIGIVNPTSVITSYLYSTGDVTPRAVIDTTGIYSVQIGNGMCFHEDTVQVTIQGEAPTVDFSFGKLCINEEVAFTDLTSDPNGISLNSYQWLFGDGDSSSLTSPNHQFDSAITYTVSLEVENDSGCVGRSEQMLTINNKPTNSFITSFSCETDSTIFVNNTLANSGTIASYQWDFGISSVLGDTSSLENPVFIYPNDSLFSINLIAENSFQCRDTLDQIINVNSKPSASFSASRFLLGDSTRFLNQSGIDSGAIITNTWNFGDGNQSMQLNPVHAYNTAGAFNVMLTVLSDSGCTDVFNDSVRIVLPTPEFSTVHPKIDQTLLDEVNFEWNQHDSARVYQFQLATDVNFTSIVADEPSLEVTSLSLNLNTTTNFFWRVFAIDNGSSIDTTNIGRFSILNPAELDSLTLWLTGDSVTLASNGRVMMWFDRSDSGRVLTQTRPNSQPDRIPNYLNGQSVIDFPGSRNNFFFNIVNVNSSNYYVSSVYDHHSSVNSFSRLFTGSSWGLGPQGTHGTFIGGLVGSGLPIVPDRPVLNTAYAQRDTVFSIINGIERGQAVPSNPPQTINMSTSSSDRMDGAVAEVIIVDGSMPRSTQRQTDNYLMDKYAPPINLGRDRIVCSFPDSIVLNHDYIVSYNWNTGSTAGAIQIDSAGLYFVQTVDVFGRESVDSIFFTLDTNDLAFTFLVDTVNSCLGDVELLFAGGSRFDYAWSTGDTTQSILVDSTATYSVSVENCFGTISTDDVVVIFNEPRFSLGPDTVGCYNDLVQLSPDSNFSQVSYLWSTNTSNSSITADTAGMYTLGVTDQFGCFFSDSVQVSIDSSLLPLTLGPDTLTCTRNEIGLVNRGSTPVTSYLYSTGNTTPTQVIDTAGIYTLRIGNGVCFKSDTIVVSLKGEAPNADFSSLKVCLNDSIEFSDLSLPAVATDTIVGWDWDFGDGKTSMIQNPINVYGTVATFTVGLTVETDKGCFDNIQKNIDIQPLPVANFTFSNQAACSKKMVDVFDLSSTSAGFITDYYWDFGDATTILDTAITADAAYIYDTTGNYIVTFAVTSSFGCVDTVQQLKLINPSPIVDFARIGDCLSDSITFLDNSTLISGGIQNYSWIFNEIPRLAFDTTFLDSVISRKFKTPGTKTVIHRVLTDAGCVDTLREVFEILPNPVVDFIAPSICEDDSIEIVNLSTSVDSIINYRFTLSNVDTLLGREPKFAGDTVGIFDLQLLANTLNGCRDSAIKIVQIHAKPEVDFEVLNDRTGIPFRLKLENNTTNADSYRWDFDNGDTAVGVLPEYTYQDTGTYTIKLIGTSDFGCIDSTSRTVTAFPFFLDALLSRIFIEENSFGEISLSAQVINNGFNTIDSIKLTADLNNDFEVSQVFNTEILRGGVAGFSFSNLFSPESGRVVDFVCMKITAVNGGQDSILINNEICERAFGNTIRLEAYPNPVDEFLTMEFVLPIDGMLDIQFYDQSGKKVLNGINQRFEEGYYTNIFNTSQLRTGIYMYRFIFNGVEKTGKFLKL